MFIFTLSLALIASTTTGSGKLRVFNNENWYTLLILAASLLYGVQLNLNPVSLPNTWSQCYNDTYNVIMNSTLHSNIISVCNKGKLMLGCRPKGNALLSVSAMGLRNDVLYNCSIHLTVVQKLLMELAGIFLMIIHGDSWVMLM